MVRRRSDEDLLNPSRAYYRLINDYVSGHLTTPGIQFLRARVEDVDPIGGKLEQNPPNPPNSVKARIYSYGMDSNIPSVALNVFYPVLPGHLSPSVERGDHIYVIFEDSQHSSGLWVTTIPSYHNLNDGNPDSREHDESDASNSFEGDSNRPSRLNSEADVGGQTHQTQGRQENVDNFENSTGNSNPWRGKRIIHIGDSMVGGAVKADGTTQDIGPAPYTLRRRLLQDFDAAFYKPLGRIGWGVRDWLRGSFSGRRLRGLAPQQPSIAELKEEYRADIVLITLGGNDAGGAVNRRDYSSKVEQLWNQARSGMDFAIWCGPPAVVGRLVIPPGEEGHSPRHYRRGFQELRDRVNDKIRSVVGNNYVDCRDFTRGNFTGRGADGVHFSPRASVGTPWANLFLSKAREIG